MLAGCGANDAVTSDDARVSYWAASMTSSITRDEEVLTPQLEAFTAETGIEVDLEVVPWDDLWNRILTAVSSGQGPDVLNIGTTWSASLQATGAFIEFDDETMQAIGGAEKFVPTSLSATGADGQAPVAVPLYGQSYALYYNTEMFTEAGLDTPGTWDEMVAAGRQLTLDTTGDGEIDQWGVTFQGGWSGVSAHLMFILGRQNGGALLDAAGQPQFDSEPQVAAARRYLDLVATDRIASPSVAELTGAGPATEFAQGNAAMVIGQATVRGVLADLGFADYGVTRLPSPRTVRDGGHDTSTMVAGTNLTVMDTTSDRAAALELVRHLTDIDAQVELNLAYGTLPVIEAAYDHEAFDDDHLRTLRDVLREYAEPFPQVPEAGQVESLLGGAMKELLARVATGDVISDDDIRAALRDAGQQLEVGR